MNGVFASSLIFHLGNLSCRRIPSLHSRVVVSLGPSSIKVMPQTLAVGLLLLFFAFLDGEKAEYRYFLGWIKVIMLEENMEWLMSIHWDKRATRNHTASRVYLAKCEPARGSLVAFTSAPFTSGRDRRLSCLKEATKQAACRCVDGAWKNAPGIDSRTGVCFVSLDHLLQPQSVPALVSVQFVFPFVLDGFVRQPGLSLALDPSSRCGLARLRHGDVRAVPVFSPSDVIGACSVLVVTHLLSRDQNMHLRT